MFSAFLSIAALILANMSAAAPPPEPLNEGEALGRATQMAEAFAGICRGSHTELTSMRAAAEAQGFTLQPERSRTNNQAFGGTVAVEHWALFSDGDDTLAPRLFARLEEWRRADGSLEVWECELVMPAGTAVPAQAEVNAVFRSINNVLPGQVWELNVDEGPMGRLFIAEQTVSGFDEAYFTFPGSHRLVRRPNRPPVMVTAPRGSAPSIETRPPPDNPKPSR